MCSMLGCPQWNDPRKQWRGMHWRYTWWWNRGIKLFFGIYMSLVEVGKAGSWRNMKYTYIYMYTYICIYIYFFPWVIFNHRHLARFSTAYPPQTAVCLWGWDKCQQRSKNKLEKWEIQDLLKPDLPPNQYIVK